MKKENIIKTEKQEEAKTTKSSTQETNLPKEFTMEPRNEEEMHLRHIGHSPSLIEIYAPVSDDKGEFVGDTGAESEVINFINRIVKAKASHNPLIDLFIFTY